MVARIVQHGHAFIRDLLCFEVMADRRPVPSQPVHASPYRRRQEDRMADETSKAGSEERRSLMTVRAVAEHLGVHPETIRRWLRDGRLVGVDLGSDSGGWRIDPRDLDAYLNARRGTRVKRA
jgi:excisionase family DNA binding protein